MLRPPQTLHALCLLLAIGCSLPNSADAQSPRVYRDRVVPTWSADGSKFWYVNRLSGNRKEYITVDAVKGTRQLAFDHQKLAQLLAKTKNGEAEADHLAISSISWADDGLLLTIRSRIWLYDEANSELTMLQDRQAADRSRFRKRPQRSGTSQQELFVTFQNESDRPVKMYWVPANGSPVLYQTLAPGKSFRQHSFVGHVWKVMVDSPMKGQQLAGYLRLQDSDDEISISQAVVAEAGGNEDPSNRPTRRKDDRGRREQRSPDGTHRVFVREHDLWIETNGEQKSLSDAGSSKNTFRKDASRGRLLSMQYSRPDYPEDVADVRWSKDSKWLLAVQTTVVPERRVTYIHSAPRDQLQPLVESYPYAKPGDEIPVPTLHLFEVDSGREVPISNDLFRNPWSLQFLNFSDDGSRFWLKYNERGHKVVRVVEVETATGTARTIVENSADTFVHYSDGGKSVMQWLPDDLMLWASERSGWNHLYLVDVAQGKIRNAVTSGSWNVKRIESVDRDNRQVWFYAVGLAEDQDPYHEHFCRVNFDGTGFVQLTEGDGTHEISFSPDRRFLIDRYSRVDLPPQHELRSASDGKLLCRLESADASELTAIRRLPERFVAKGRDGETDISGIIHFPKRFDPTLRYPIVENIYAGPHDHHVPKAFRSSYRHQHQIADRGMLVVQIDGMGTAWRSKKFHDVCYRNLKDAGFPDRIRWIKAAALKYGFMDPSRVGIYGGSAGGQNAMAALLWHNDFYKAAVADCGCHDNRMDKIWWNEQWMGIVEGDHYERNSNTVNASRLKGELMLVVGERDRNVDPASTTQVLKALIDSNKDFEFLPVIGAGHGACETPYASRRRADFLENALTDSPE